MFDRLLAGARGPTPAIEVSGLVKTFAGVRAVDELDLVVAPGVVHGVLGPNGAGKTTTIRILATLLRPDAGEARLFGHDVVAHAERVRGRLGLTGQFASVDDDLTARENLVLVARLLGYPGRRAKARADDLLDVFGLAEAAGRLTKQLSGGMRRRLDIAASLVVAPDLLFLDEPTTGLDPHRRSDVWDIVRDLVAAGTTVLLTTQYLEEADRLADRISVIEQGRVIAEGTAGELKASIGSSVLHLRLARPHDRPRVVRLLQHTLDVTVHPERERGVVVATVADPGRVAQVLAAAEHDGVRFLQFALAQPSLDEVFLALTGRSTGEPDTDGGPDPLEAA